MDDSRDRTTLLPIWEQRRARVLAYGQALAALLPEGEPPVTLHGRDLRPGDEGVGCQFQYALSGELYSGEVAGACFVVQVELVRGRTSLAWKIDAAPLLERADGRYELYGRRGTLLPLADGRRARWFFAEPLTRAATRFVERVRAGEPIQETLTEFDKDTGLMTQVVAP